MIFVMALQLPTGPLKNPALCSSRYQDVNPVPISSFVDDPATVPLRLVVC